MQNGYVLGYRPLIVGGAPCCGFRNGKAAAEPAKQEQEQEQAPVQPIVIVLVIGQ